MLTFSSVSITANEVRGENRRGGTLGDWKNKAGFCFAGLRTQRWPCAHQADTEPPGHLWRAGSGHFPHLVLKSTDAKPFLETSTAFASAQARCLSCILYITQNHHSQHQCQANARHSSFSQIFPICSWLWIRGYRTQRLWRLTVVGVFRGKSAQEKTLPLGELKKQWKFWAS